MTGRLAMWHRTPSGRAARPRVMPRTPTEDRACCSVERKASVDSVPWLRFAPSASRPSKAPPVAGSHMRHRCRCHRGTTGQRTVRRPTAGSPSTAGRGHTRRRGPPLRWAVGRMRDPDHRGPPPERRDPEVALSSRARAATPGGPAHAARARGVPSAVPAAIIASGSEALAYVSRCLGPCPLRPRPVRSSDRRSRRAGRALALVGLHAEHFGCAKCGECHRPRPRRALRTLLARTAAWSPEPQLVVRAVCGRVPSPQMLRPQQSPSRRRVFPPARSAHPIAALSLRVERLVEGISDSRWRVDRLRRVAVAFSSWDDEHPRHVVTAVAVLWSGLIKQGMLEGAALVGHVDQVREVRLGDGTTSHQRQSLSGAGVPQTQVFTGHHRPAEARRNSRRLGGHRRGQLRPGQHHPEGTRHGIGVVVVDHEAGPAGEQLDGVRKGRRDHRSSGCNRVHQDARRSPVPWSRTGSRTTRWTGSSVVSDATSR